MIDFLKQKSQILLDFLSRVILFQIDLVVKNFPQLFSELIFDDMSHVYIIFKLISRFKMVVLQSFRSDSSCSRTEEVEPVSQSGSSTTTKMKD